MSVPDLDIGVVYTYERDLMPRLLDTMALSGEGLRVRLVLVDNAAEEGVEGWARRFPETITVRNPVRLGYAANLNRVLRAATAPYVLLMNTDMYFDPRQQCLKRMVEFMESQPKCGVAGCRLLHADGGDAFAARRFPTLPLILSRRCGLGGLFDGAVGHHFYDEHRPEETWPCDWLSGCFLMVRRAAIDQVGPFDEGYGKYFEDVDMCRRMAERGWQVMYHGGVSCYHLESRASKRLFSPDAWIHLRAYCRWLRKWGLGTTTKPSPAG